MCTINYYVKALHDKAERKRKIKYSKNLIDKIVEEDKTWKSIPLEPEIFLIFADQIVFYLSFTSV